MLTDRYLAGYRKEITLYPARYIYEQIVNCKEFSENYLTIKHYCGIMCTAKQTKQHT